MDRKFQINRLIKNIADQLRLEDSRPRPDRGSVGEEVCSEHGESLKLFCETDNQLICVICRDGREHRGHTFKPVKEAQEELRAQLKSVLSGSSRQIIAVVNKRIYEQNKVLSDKRQKIDEVQRKIKAQFEEVIVKLREKEEQAMSRINSKSGLDKIEHRLTEMRRYLDEAAERNTSLHSGLEMNDPLEFIWWWREKGSALCDTSPQCPEVYKPSVRPLQKLENIDYDSFMGCINWDKIKTILEWIIRTVEVTSFINLFRLFRR